MEHNRFIDLLYGRARRVHVTTALIVLNALAFVVSAGMAGNVMQIGSAVLLNLGANHSPLVMHGEAWRLVTAMFLHGGLLHIGLNMFALYQAGQIVERLYGATGFLLLYLGAGLAGNVASVWWNPNGISVGASGAVFGIYGALLAYLRAEPGSIPLSVFNRIRSLTLAFIGYSLFAGVAIPGIDNAAHLGGLLGGIALGYGFARPLSAVRALELHSARALVAIAVVVVACAWMWHRVPATQQGARIVRVPADGGLGRALAQLTFEEATLVARTNGLLDNLRKEKLGAEQAVAEMRNELVPRWQVQVDALSRITVPEGAYEKRRRLLVRYTELRRDALIATADAISRQDEARLHEANDLQRQADDLIEGLRDE